MVVMEEAVAEGAAASEDVNLVELMNARARSYGMLARLFREEVDLPTLRELQKMRFPQATGNAAADEGYHQLYDYLKRAWDDSVTEPRHRLREHVHRPRRERVFRRLSVRVGVHVRAPSAHAGGPRRGARHAARKRVETR